MQAREVTVSLVNDYEIIVHGLRRMLEPFAGRLRIVETEAGGMPDADADIVLFDTFAGRRHALDRLEEIAATRTARHPRLVLYTWDIPTDFASAIEESDVDGVILKSQRGEDLVERLERVAAGQQVGQELLNDTGDVDAVALTDRETEILALLARGFTNPEIARELYLSVETIKTHVRSLLRKLGVENRTQAALLAVKFGVAPPPERASGHVRG